MSPKIHIPSKDAATPRIADEIICVIGEVTLILRTLAMLMRKPSTPCASRHSAHQPSDLETLARLTVMADPHKKVVSGLHWPSRT